MKSPLRSAVGPVQRMRTVVQKWLHAMRLWPWWDTIRTLRLRFRDDRLGQTAGSLTFTTLIALVPLVTVMLAVFTAFPMFANFESALERYFLQNLVPDNIARPVMRSLTQFAVKARGVGALGLLLLGVTALALTLTIDRALNAIWRVRKPRPIAQRVLVYWAALTLGPLALGVSLSMTSYAVSASRGLVASLPGGIGVLLDIVQFLMLAGAAAGLFHYVPNTAVRWRHAWAGGLFVAAGFEVAKKVLALYVDFVPTFSAVYGAFATLPILLLWIYLGWVIVLLGAVIAAYAPSLQMRVASREASPGWQFELALAVLGQLAAARNGVERGLPMATIAEALRADPLQLAPVVDMLVEIDWVSRLDEGAGEGVGARHVLLCDPDATNLLPLVNRTLMAPGEATSAFRRHVALDRLKLADALGGAGCTKGV
ncbi:MAG TPA: YihY family inner membrane protein [Rubrivivax sp.]|nr:YihY family inner membrane protein [Rubrivivax sp.]